MVRLTRAIWPDTSKGEAIMALSKYESFIARKRVEYGERFDPSDLDQRFVGAFNTGARIKVRMYGEDAITGTVGVTTGWRPAFLLMRTSRSLGSSNLLNAGAEIVAIKHEGERQYRAVRSA